MTGGNEGRITDGGKEENETDNEEDRQPDREEFSKTDRGKTKEED